MTGQYRRPLCFPAANMRDVRKNANLAVAKQACRALDELRGNVPVAFSNEVQLDDALWQRPLVNRVQ